MTSTASRPGIFSYLLASWKLFRLIIHLFVGILLASLFVPANTRWGCQENPRAESLYLWWSRSLCRIFNAKINVKGKLSQQPALYVMNHISWFDIPALAAQYPFHFLSKSEVRHWPLIGWLSARVGTLFIQRGAAGAAQKSLQEIVDCLSRGGSVVIFPEGTTTDGLHLKKFHGRLLQAAIDAQVNIQPVALRYPYKGGVNTRVPYIDDRSFMDSVVGLIQSKPLELELHFLDPINPQTLEDNSNARKQLAQLSRAAICQQLNIDA